MKRRLFVVVLLLVPLLLMFAGGKGEQATTTAGPAVQQVKLGEIPVLKDLVASGKLPAMKDRLPDKPAVMRVVDGIGKYGGTIHVFASLQDPYATFQGQERGYYMLGFTDDMKIVGDVLDSYELSTDAKSVTLRIRKGMKWSDGVPLSADDFVFNIEQVAWDKNVETWGVWGTPGNPFTKVTAVDPLTVRYDMAKPDAGILVKLASWMGSGWIFVQPKHYLAKYHIATNPQADDVAKAEGYKSWKEAFAFHLDFRELNDFNKPTLAPFKIKSFTSNSRVYERNPFYYKVDPAGNQLPYIDRVEVQIVDQEVLNLKLISGESDVEFTSAGLENYTLYKENASKGNYQVVLIPGSVGADNAVAFYQNSPDPVMGPLYRDVRFREALSLAINREEINQTIYQGLATPRQATVTSTASYYKPAWAASYSQLDVAKANSLLDEIGLTKKDAQGFRQTQDGKPIQVLLEMNGDKPSQELELIKEYWAKVGIDTALKAEERNLWQQRGSSPDHGSFVQTVYNSDEVPLYGEPGYWDPPGSDLSWGTEWGKWLDANDDVQSGGKKLSDFEGGKLPGQEPPAEVKQLHSWIQQWQASVFATPAYRDLATRIFDFHAKQLYMVGTVGESPFPIIAKNTLGNVPKKYAPGLGAWQGELNYWSSQLYFK